MSRSTLPRYDFLISRRRYDPADTLDDDTANAYAVWRFDPGSPELLSPVPVAPDARFDRRHSLVQVGNYLLEWGPIAQKAYGGAFPYRLFMFDPTNGRPLDLSAHTSVQKSYGTASVSTSVQKGQWPKSKFWAYRPDFGNPHGASEGYDSGEQLLLYPLGSWLLNVIPTVGRGTFQLWNFDPAPLTPGSHDPLPAPYQPQGSFDYVQIGHELIPMGNYVIDRCLEDGSWQVLSFDPQNPMLLPQPPVQQGRWSDIDARHQLLPIGELLLDWVPEDRSYRLWQFDPHAAEPLVGPLRSGTLPKSFDAMTTLTAVQPRVPIDDLRAQQPGSLDFMRTKIKHVVYLMLENRSFDHVLGWLHEKAPRDGRGLHFVGDDRPFDGASTEMFNPDPTNAEQPGKPVYLSKYLDGKPSNKAMLDFLPNDPYHDKTDVMRQFFYGMKEGYAQRAKPGMKGFVFNNGVEQVMWTYTPEQLPVLNGLAAEFAVSDAWFASMPSATDPNRAFAFTGSALTMLNNFQNGVQYTYWNETPRRQSLWKLLWSQGITDWKMYHSVLWMNYVHTYHLFVQGQIPTVDANVNSYIFPIEQFITDAKAGELPAFSYLEPAWIAPTGTTSYHPGADLVPGERALADLYEAMRNGPGWNETLFIINFDEHGGLFDHAPPPYAVNPWPHDANDGFRYDLLGPRVPAIVVSPWVEASTVFRSGDEETPFDHTSVMATLLSWFGVPRSRWAMGDRAERAPTFETVLTRKSPRRDTPQTLKRPSDLQFPPEQGSSHPLPVHDLHRLMLPRIVWGLVKDRLSPSEAAKLSDEMLAEARDLQSLHAAVEKLRR